MKDNTISAGSTKTKRLTLIGLSAALLCILGPLSIPLPVSPVPITLTNFAVYIIIYILGMHSGTVSVLIYLCLGAVGLPVFSAFSGGLGKLAGPTRIPCRVPLPRPDPGIPHGALPGKKYSGCLRHDPRAGSMLSLRHNMACPADEPYLHSRSRCRRASVPPGRCGQDHSRRSGWSKTESRSETDITPLHSGSHF